MATSRFLLAWPAAKLCLRSVISPTHLHHSLPLAALLAPFHHTVSTGDIPACTSGAPDSSGELSGMSRSNFSSDSLERAKCDPRLWDLGTGQPTSTQVSVSERCLQAPGDAAWISLKFGGLFD